MSHLTEIETINDRIESISAYIQSFEAGPDQALTQLNRLPSPDSYRQRLKILIDAGRFREGADLVREMPIHYRWADKAIMAFIANGEASKAEEIWQWAKQQQTGNILSQCTLSLAEARYVRAFRNRTPEERIFPGTTTDQEIQELKSALLPLNGFLTVIKERGRIDTEFESKAVQIAIHVYGLLSESDELEALLILLMQRRPVPLRVAEFVAQGTIPPSLDLPTRLRIDHPKNFKALILACVIEGEILGLAQTAFTSGLKLLDEQTDKTEKEQILQFLFNQAQAIGIAALQKVRDIAPSILEKGHPFLNFLKIDECLRSSKPTEALLLLESTRLDSDTNWLQQYASCLAELGKGAEAVEYLLKASRISPNIHMLETTASLAFKYGSFEVAAEALERLVKILPKDIPARRNLTLIYARLQKFVEVAREFAVLQQLVPNEVQFALGRANALALSGDGKGSLDAYADLCRLPNAPLEAYLGKARILSALHKHTDAYAILISVRDQYWDRQEYVGALLSVGFAAGEEKIAHEALFRLQELQKEGKADANVLEVKQIDEVIADIRGREQYEQSLQTQLLQGKTPWLLADHALGSVTYGAWFTRTRPMDWIFDDPTNRASLTIYSTNHYTVLLRHDSSRQLEEIECPTNSTSVVADLSALITIHRLGLLQDAASFFGKILIPSAYLSRVLNEASRLSDHQLSAKTAARVINSAIESGKIRVTDDASCGITTIHEYSLENEGDNFYHLKDIDNLLYTQGRLSEREHESLTLLAHRPARTDLSHPYLTLGQKLLIRATTLRTLDQASLLQTVIDNFAVEITRSDREEIFSEDRWFAAREEIASWHDDLWQQIRVDAHFIQTTAVIPPQSNTTDGEAKEHEERELPIALSAVFLASQLQVPLLVDDRVCQAMLLNQGQTNSQAAFGSDQLLDIFEKKGILSIDRIAEAYLKLISWRYRFLLLPPSVLLALAKKYINHPPGEDLKKVAFYIHDCMRDPGLFGGFEPTQPPASIAGQLYMGWIRNIAAFLMNVWRDTSISDESARELTKWTVSQMLPSPPRALGQLGARLASMRSDLFLSYAFFQSISVSKSRANRGLLAIAGALGMSQEEYLRICTEVMDEVKSSK